MTEKTFRRNNFFSGRLLSAADLELEQNYFRSKLKLHNRLMHGFGIVSGLEVSSSGGELHVSSGVAIDCEGNEIVVVERCAHPLPTLCSDTSLFLTIQYREQQTNPTPAVGSEALSESSVIEEVFVLEFESQNPNQNHRHERGRWQACGQPHGLVLARLRKTSAQWRIDRRLRRPLVK